MRTSNHSANRRPRSRRRSAEDNPGQSERRDAFFKKELKLRIHYFLESDEEVLELEAMNSFKRRVLHNMAKDYGLASDSEGDDNDRHVRLVKTEDTLPAEELSEIGPLEEELPTHSSAYEEDKPAYRPRSGAPAERGGKRSARGNSRGSASRGGASRGNASSDRGRSRTESSQRSNANRDRGRSNPRGRRDGQESEAPTPRGHSTEKPWDFGEQTFLIQPGDDGVRMALTQDGSVVLWHESLENVLSECLVTTREIRVRNGRIVQANEEGW